MVGRRALRPMQMQDTAQQGTIYDGDGASLAAMTKELQELKGLYNTLLEEHETLETERGRLATCVEKMREAFAEIRSQADTFHDEKQQPERDPERAITHWVELLRSRK